jgi:uncharacterized protein YutE (UPF0331/DUF86 family)
MSPSKVSRNTWSAESCLRRALEALFDIGRHVLARAYGLGCSEYCEIAAKLADCSVLSADESARDLGDLATIRMALVRWLTAHPEMVDETL